jgi:hypothetical protein
MRPVTWLLLAVLAHVPGVSLAGESAWSEAQPAVKQRIAQGEPLVVHVMIPLCHSDQINCGSGGLGSPGNLRTNLYWGALYGARRIFDRKQSGWQKVEQTTPVVGDHILARAVYRRQVDGKRWNRDDDVEQLVVLDAVHGARINNAVEQFFTNATSGAKLTIDDAGERRTITVSAAGYAGHNRLMDGMQLPKLARRSKRKPVASFVMACLSDRFFSDSLREAGSAPMVMTRSFMAPEGYVVEATARAIGDNLSQPAMRRAVVHAYAHWQRISLTSASRVFSK